MGAGHVPQAHQVRLPWRAWAHPAAVDPMRVPPQHSMLTDPLRAASQLLKWAGTWRQLMDTLPSKPPEGLRTTTNRNYSIARQIRSRWYVALPWRSINCSASAANSRARSSSRLQSALAAGKLSSRDSSARCHDRG